MKEMPPQSIRTAMLSAMLNDDGWRQGRLCRRANLASTELIDRDEADIASIDEQVNSVIEILESPIEQVAAYHLLGRNYAPFTTTETIFPILFPSLPEIWPDNLVIAIVPQVEIGRYRVDFMVHLRSGAKFAIECDGDEYHDDIRDGIRDSALTRHFKVPVIRFSGATIWESPLWTNDVRKTVFMLLGMRNAEVIKRG